MSAMLMRHRLIFGGVGVVDVVSSIVLYIRVVWCGRSGSVCGINCGDIIDLLITRRQKTKSLLLLYFTVSCAVVTSMINGLICF